jgi:hypothetical protein
MFWPARFAVLAAFAAFEAVAVLVAGAADFIALFLGVAFLGVVLGVLAAFALGAAVLVFLDLLVVFAILPFLLEI